MNPWTNPGYAYSVIQLNLGNNPLSKIEIVSCLNSFNIAHWHYAYDAGSRPSRFYPKLYLSAVQSVASGWNLDNQDSQKVDPKWVTANDQKSGSWPRLNTISL